MSRRSSPSASNKSDGESSDSGLDTVSSSTGTNFPSDYMDLDEFLSAQTHDGPGNEDEPKYCENAQDQRLACPTRAVAIARTNSNQMGEGTTQSKTAREGSNVMNSHAPSFPLKMDSNVLQSIEANSRSQPSATNAIIQWCKSVSVAPQVEQSHRAADVATARAPSRRRRSAKYVYNPLPISKKADRKFVCQAEKDEKYWERRIKNNVAAKRSRDMRRQKEIEISEKFKTLERENARLKNEVQTLRMQAVELERKLANLQGANM
ncbi:thyrotroph embryonic factor-like [Montipora foliosa]|uniref:thyrotroph embryonic factor-like n=1 Tax=Montipora foliosa TaxID=591990 RepID=UPI0035F128C4